MQGSGGKYTELKIDSNGKCGGLGGRGEGLWVDEWGYECGCGCECVYVQQYLSFMYCSFVPRLFSLVCM